MLQQDSSPGISLFNYKNGKQPDFSPHLFEAYWDIVISLGFLERCKLTSGRRMLHGKVEALTNVRFNKEEGFIKYEDIFTEYLQKRTVAATNVSGASDITVAYINEYETPVVTDKCSYTQPQETKLLPPVFYLFSSKFYKSEKSTGDYDVERIHLASKKLRENNTDIRVKIPILARNKHVLDGKLDRALSRFVADEIDKPIEGLDELLGHLNRIYNLVRTKLTNPVEISIDSLSTFFNVKSKGDPKEFLSLRFHQQMAVDKITRSIQEEAKKGLTNINNKFLVGILPRGGKTYVAGGIIYALKANRVLVILGAKTETEPQFIDELFNKFANFNDYKVINLLNDKTIKLEKTNKYIIVSSIELLVKGQSKDAKVRREIMEQLLSEKSGEAADLIIYDEAHLKGTRGKGRGALGKLAKIDENTDTDADTEVEDDVKIDDAELEAISNTNNVPVVFFTGTYRKPRDLFNIPENRLFIWDYQDVQRAKNLESELPYFRKQFPSTTDDTLELLQKQNKTLKTIEADYKKFPDLFLISQKFTESDGPNFLDMEDLLKASPIDKDTPEEEWSNSLTQPAKVTELLNYFSPFNKTNSQLGAPDESESRFYTALDCIDISAQGANDRLRGISQTASIKNHIHSQLWFLPKTKGSPLQHRLKALASAMMQHEYIGVNFNVICVYSAKGTDKVRISKRFEKGGEIVFQPNYCKGDADIDPETKKHSLKTCIQKYEESCRNEKKPRGLIILAQDKLKLGVSLPCVDIVVLLDDSKNADERIQKMYRALTESDNKRCGFIVDMNYFRCIDSIIEYQLTRERQKKKQDIADPKAFINEIFTDIYAFNTHKYITMEVSEGTDIKELLRDGLHKDYDSVLEYTKGSVEEAGRRFNIEMDALVPDIEISEDIQTALKLGHKNSENISDDKNHKKAKGKIDARKLAELKEQKNEYAKKKAELAAALKEAIERGDEDAIAAAKKMEEEAKRVNEAYAEALLESKQTTTDAISEIYKFISKYAAFTSEKKDLEEYLEFLSSAEERNLRIEIYDALIRRGAFIDKKTSDDEKDSIIIKVLAPLLNKIKTSDKNKELFKIMAERVAAYKCDDAAALKYISDNLTPKEEERHKYGEVFTPLTLVDEMLSKLPKTVWSEWDYKWLDPANGIGNFPLKAYLGQSEGEFKYPGLKNGLKRAFPDKDEKEIIQHIFNDMLYMVEINPTNNKIAREHVFGRCLGNIPGVKLNIEPIDPLEGFLSSKPLIFNGKEIKDFHVIMGNPPFQGGAVRGKSTNATRKRREEKDQGQDKHKNLWIPFVKTAITRYLKPNGILLFIHPIGWFKPDRTGIHEEMLKYQITDIRIYDMYQSMKLFSGKGKISVAYYLLKNKPRSGLTTIMDRVGKEDAIELNEKSIIILAANSIFAKVQEKSPLFYEGDEHRVSSIELVKCSSGSNKQIHRINESGEMTVVETSNVHVDQKAPKLYLSGYQTPRVFHDKKGEYGLIGSHQHYFVGSDLDKLEDFFKTKLSALLLKHTKYDQEFIEPKFYPDVRSLHIDKITDETLAKYYKFSTEEIRTIEETELPERKYTTQIKNCAELKKSASNNNMTRKLCTPPKELNKKKTKCLDPCPDKQTRNPRTGRCVKVKGGRFTRKIRR